MDVTTKESDAKIDDVDGLATDSRSNSDVAPQKTSLGQKLKTHFRKWWWLHLVITVCITLIVVLVVIYVGIKSIVQTQVSKATLTVISEAATDPQPESFHFRLETQHISHSKYKPIIESFNASLSLPGSDMPFAYFTTPDMKANAVFNMTIDQELLVADPDTFVAWNKAVFFNQTVDILVRGYPKVALGGLPKYTVKYDQIASQRGLNGLPDFEILSVSLFSTPDPVDNATLEATISIPNPSVLTVGMGNIVGKLYSSTNGTYLGYSKIANFTLRPGSNCFATRGFINATEITKYINGDSVLPLEIRGFQSVNSAGEEIDYYSQTLQNSIIKYGLKVTPDVLSGKGAQCPGSS